MRSIWIEEHSGNQEKCYNKLHFTTYPFQGVQARFGDFLVREQFVALAGECRFHFLFFYLPLCLSSLTDDRTPKFYHPIYPMVTNIPSPPPSFIRVLQCNIYFSYNNMMEYMNLFRNIWEAEGIPLNNKHSCHLLRTFPSFVFLSWNSHRDLISNFL